MGICVECAYVDAHDQPDKTCSNSALPLSEFVYGNRFCVALNDDGRCIGFKPKAEAKSRSRVNLRTQIR